MAFCIECGQELPDGAKFCVNCGTPINGIQNKSQRKEIYEGELYKCPHCGEVLESFSANCPYCGYELRGIDNSSSVRILVSKLEKLESIKPAKNKVNIFKQAIIGGQLTNIDEQKVEVIRNFTIPNTKEDVREFIILASSNIDIKLYGMEYHSSQVQGMLVASQKAVSDAWLAKFEQAYQKAQLLFAGTQELKNVQALYERKMKEIKIRKWQFPLIIGGAFFGLSLLLGIIFIIAL